MPGHSPSTPLLYRPGIPSPIVTVYRHDKHLPNEVLYPPIYTRKLDFCFRLISDKLAFEVLLGLAAAMYAATHVRERFRNMKGKLHTIITAILAIVAIGLCIALFITYTSRYDAGFQVGYASGNKAGYAKGVDAGEKSQIQSLKADRHKAVVPDLVGQNASQVGHESYNGAFYASMANGAVNLPLKFKAPDGEAITKDNAKNYKVVSQEPKANTVFDVSYMKDENGKEYDSLVETTGVQSITLTVEKIAK